MRYLTTIILGASLAAAPAAAQEEAPFQLSLGEKYAACTSLVQTDPEQGYKKARAWLDETGALAAQHCKALALFEMNDFAGSARELDAILRSVTPAQRRLWLNMKIQAAKAHMYAQDFISAERHLSDSLKWTSQQEGMESDMVPLLIQRSRIYALHNEHLRAINDLDHALSIQEDQAVYLERARVFIKMGKTDSAIDDINLVLAKDPLNEEASMLLGKAERRMRDLARRKRR